MGEIKVPAQSTCVQEVLSKRPDLPHCHHVPWSSKRTDRPTLMVALGFPAPAARSLPHPAPPPSHQSQGQAASSLPPLAQPLLSAGSHPCLLTLLGAFLGQQGLPTPSPHFTANSAGWVASGTWPKGWAWAGPGLGVSLWPMLGSSVLKCDQCSPRPETQPDACPAPSLYTSGSQGQ